jgi:hypothetical protein
LLLEYGGPGRRCLLVVASCWLQPSPIHLCLRSLLRVCVLVWSLRTSSPELWPPPSTSWALAPLQCILSLLVWLLP